MEDYSLQTILTSKIEAGDFSSGGEASSNLKEILRKLGVSSDIIRKIAIITYELEMNIIIHSVGGKLKARVSPQVVKVIATDKGPGIEDVDKAFQPGFSTASDSIREMGFGAGMGLCNIKQCSDQLDVETELNVGTTIVASICL
ncbi:anti-sigma regulatory factor (Ser/Thr protein kinase) [Halobacteroides halobius DSM 5150]|uniref:Anti-sigma regulatory factor (Ser/Thr protein kinase) n=1 Tax=Halobacteroides halobius (strain ATCC 35273 / DSM 5150 / MD-1) TaxID=748449 RepID=L0KC21_HALHC|nr:ATP-binding protein [Halobacteroides halobius]AGB41914.1 anti-sigma regulatory factor (Ser/Thr protein kinase) [Halobacteroides halobius DSM 5150]